MRRALLALAALSCSSCFYVEAEEPSVCRTLSNQTIDPGPMGSTTYSHVYSYDFGSELISLGGSKTKTTIQVLSVTLKLVSGSSGLDFIQSGTVALQDSSNTLPEVQVLQYQHDATSDPHQLTIGAGQPVDVTAYLANHHMLAHVTLTGGFPSTPITVDVKACLKTVVHDDYL